MEAISYCCKDVYLRFCRSLLSASYSEFNYHAYKYTIHINCLYIFFGEKSFALWEGESKISNVPEEKFKAIDIDTASLEAFDGGVLCAEVNVHHIVI